MQRKYLTTRSAVSVPGHLEKGAGRTYFSVPFTERDQAKRLGAEWDIAAGAWFVPTDVDLTLFKRWRQTQKH